MFTFYRMHVKIYLLHSIVIYTYYEVVFFHWILCFDIMHLHVIDISGTENHKEIDLSAEHGFNCDKHGGDIKSSRVKDVLASVADVHRWAKI